MAARVTGLPAAPRQASSRLLKNYFRSYRSAEALLHTKVRRGGEFFGSLLVAVVVMLFALAHRNHAAMGDFAFHMLELDRSVVDAKIVV